MAKCSSIAEVYRLALIAGSLIVGMLGSGVVAQDQKVRKSALKYYQKAIEAERARNLDRSIDYLKTALRRSPGFLKAHRRLIYLYTLLAREDQIEEQLRAMTESLPYLKGPYLQLTERLFLRGKYDEASTYLSKYFELEDDPSQSALRIRSSIEYAKAELKEPRAIRGTQLSGQVNAFATQYFPSLTLDQKRLLFTARRSLDYRSDEDLYMSERSSEDMPWSLPEALPRTVNSSGNEGTATLSSDGRVLIFTACQRTDGFGSCDLYVSRYLNGSWSPSKPLDAPVNSLHWESQPSLSLDGRTLYFSSDRPGGLGKKDLWYTQQDNKNRWQEPQNLGAPINTIEDEISPFIHPNHTSLYFSSSGHVGLGGFDVLRSELKKEGWSQPLNLGYPLNDWHHQVSFIVNRRGDIAYYTHEVPHPSGNQQGYLYQVTLPRHAQIGRRAPLLRGTVRDALTDKPLRSRLELFVLGETESTYQLESHEEDGRYALVLPEGEDYLLYARARGYLLSSNSFRRGQEDIQELDIRLHPLSEGRSQTLDHVYFKFDSYEIGRLSVTELKAVARFLGDHPQIRIEISGHTDSSGRSDYNLRLSERRAESVYLFLTKEGVPSSRMKYIGRGATQPKRPNDTEANRAVNRRIEFRVLE